jgi:hypothetical protein
MIRKTLAVSILLALLLLLSGCDAMLEFLYPEFKDSYEIEVWVELDALALDWNSSPQDIYVDLYDEIGFVARHKETGMLNFAWLFSGSGLEAGSYSVRAYWDSNDDGPDASDPNFNHDGAFTVNLTEDTKSQYWPLVIDALP